MSKNRVRMTVFGGGLLLCGMLPADEYLWMAEPPNGAWSTSEPNWNAGVAWPATAGHTAVFSASAQQTISVAGALDVGAVRFLTNGYRVDGAALTFSGAAPVISVETMEAAALLETPVLNEGLLSKTGPGLLRLGAAPYDGGTNVRDVAVTDGMLQVEEGRSLCSTGVWSVAAGAAYLQSGGTNRLQSGGDVFIVGQGGEATRTARVEVTGGFLLAPATAATAGYNAWFILGKDRDAWFRVAGAASVQTIVMEMNPDLVPGRTSILQLDGGRFTVNRVTGTAGVSGTVSRVLLNGGEIYAGGSNGAFIGDMTEALVQAGGAVITVPGSWYYKTQQELSHDPSLGGTPDGGLTKRGTGSLYLQANNTYSGVTRVDQGFLHVGANRALGTGPAEVGTGSSDAALVGDTGMFTVTNTVTLGLNGSVCAVTNASLALTHIGFVPGYEQIKVGGGKTDGTVRLTIDPASTTRVYNIFVYDRNKLVLDSGTVIRQTDPMTNAVSRVSVRAGSLLNVRDADIQMPDINYLLLSGGEYWQEGGKALFPYVLASTNWPDSMLPSSPARVVLDHGTLTFTAAKMFSGSNRRGTETVVNGGTLTAKSLNLSKSTQQVSLTHTLELNGGVLEAEGISYEGGESAVETATVRLNGGTLRVAAASVATNDFISVSGLNLLSVYLESGGFVCDTAGTETTVRQTLAIDPALAGAPDGGVVKKGEGCLTLTKTIAVSGPVRVEKGTLRLTDAQLAGTNVDVQSGGTLDLYSGRISHASVTVAAGGTLRIAEADPAAMVTNGSFEIYTPGQLSAANKHRYSPLGTGWTYSSGTTAGIQTNGSGFSSDPAYYTTNGGVAAFVKEGFVATNFAVAKAGTYLLSFEQATRNGYSSWARVLDVKIDGQIIHTVRHGGELHGFRPESVMVPLAAGSHNLAFVGRTSSVENANAAVLIDAVKLTAVGPVSFDTATVLNLTSGSTLVLDNTTPIYVEYIYVDGVRKRDVLRAGSSGGVTVVGDGKLKTVLGGTIMRVQ